LHFTIELQHIIAKSTAVTGSVID